jgi:hypothetical protein
MRPTSNQSPSNQPTPDQNTSHPSTSNSSPLNQPISKPPPSNKLPVQEWVIVGLILAIMTTILLVTSFNSRSTPKEVSKPLILEEIEVKITGAIAKPGYYILPIGTTLETLLEKVEVLPEANTTRLNMKKSLRDGQKIHIQSIPTVTIYLEGAIHKSGPLQVPKGTRVKDLIEIADLTREADLDSLDKKRQLKEGETIKVKLKNTPCEPSKKKKTKKNKKNKKSSL